MKFLGTAAADALPNPFCSCRLCEEARQNPGNARLRSMFLLDERNLIDCGPDLAAACMKQRVNLTELENVFVTHTHEDHFCTSNAGILHMSVTRPDKPLDIYLSEGAYAMLLHMREILGSKYAYLDSAKDFDRGLIRLHPVQTNVPFEVGGYRVLAVDTTHRVSEQETAVNFLFEKDGQRLLYACDTGFYPSETLDTLSGSRVDRLILESTFGSRTDNCTKSHMNCEAFVQMLDILLNREIIRTDTKVYATHINHKHSFTAKDMQEWFDRHSNLPVTVAYDGLGLVRCSAERSEHREQ